MTCVLLGLKKGCPGERLNAKALKLKSGFTVRFLVVHHVSNGTAHLYREALRYRQSRTV
jgi:hypothetical protein